VPRRFLQHRKTLLLAVVALAPPFADAYPISPVTLWELVERSEIIVLAEVESVSSLEQKTNEWNSAVAKLQVLETWKGRASGTLEVPYPANMICPAPPVYDPGHQVIAFLVREKGILSTTGLSYGTRYPETADDASAYRTAVARALQILQAHRGGLVEGAARRAWQIGLVAHDATRWDGLYALAPEADERHARYDHRGNPTGLSDDERTQLARAFVAAPPVDGTLPVMLRALRQVNDPAVTAAAVEAYDAVLRARHFPWWAEEVLPLIAERLGQRRPDAGHVSWITQTFRDAATASWSGQAQEVEPGVQRAWAELKRRFKLAPRPLPHARDDNRQRPVGGDTTL
jgi:hypothetical protein